MRRHLRFGKGALFSLCVMRRHLPFGKGAIFNLCLMRRHLRFDQGALFSLCVILWRLQIHKNQIALNNCKLVDFVLLRGFLQFVCDAPAFTLR